MGKPAKSLVGAKFGRLIVIQRAGVTSGSVMWKVVCQCGVSKTVSGSNLRSGDVTSCGCYKREIHTVHGFARHPLYFVWVNMIRRCGSDKYGKTYNTLKVYKPWHNIKTFIKYIETKLGAKPTASHSIDRIENNRGYYPGNIRWATKSEQSNNRKSVRRFTYKGETETVRYFADKYGVKFATVRNRLRKGYSICQALETDLGKRVLKTPTHQVLQFGKVRPIRPIKVG